MFERIQRSWELVKASWEVLRADKELMIFPLISAVASIIVFATFLVPSILAGLFDEASESGVPIAGYIVAFLFYVVMYTVTIFFNSAVVGAATIRLQGGDPTVRDGLSIAFSKFGVIVQYAVIAATVGMVLRALRERGGIMGAIASFIGGIAWNLATFLVVPVLVMEEVGPIEAIKRSASLLKKTWGEQVVGNLSIGLIFGLLTFVVILAGIIGAAIAISIDVIALAVVIGIITVLLVLGLSLISATLSGIYLAAVYQYATVGESNQFFSPDLIEGAFTPK